MSQFNKVIDTASRLADQAARATGRLVAKGQDKVDQMALQARLAKLHRQLGALVYSQKASGDENEAMVDWYIAEITRVKKRLAAYGAPRPDNVTVAEGEGVQEDAMFCGGGGA